MTPVVAMVGIFGPATIVVLLFVVQSLVLVEKVTKDMCFEIGCYDSFWRFLPSSVVIVDFSLPYRMHIGDLISINRWCW